MKPSIILINGSPDKNGNCNFLLKRMERYLNDKGCSCEIIDINSLLLQLKIPFCINCSSPCSQVCYKNTPFEEAMTKACNADGLVFASPVYFGSMSAQLKSFFDKCRDARGKKLFLGKPACAVSVGATKYGGQETTVRAIHDCMLVLGMSIVGDSSFDSAGHFGLCAQKESKSDDYALKRAEALSDRLFIEANKYLKFKS